MRDLMLRALAGEHTERPPVWLMRQAGRYMPEYREIRSDMSFREAIRDPEVAERITMLPWRSFEPDGLVIYSDILTVLEPMGWSYEIRSGVGPVIDGPVEDPEDVREVELEFDVTEELGYVGEVVRRVSESEADAATIGFAGGPHTLASYVVGEPGDRDAIRAFRARHPEAYLDLLDAFTDVVRRYLEFQVEMGADVVQLFDTWAGLLPPAEHRDNLVPRHREILEGLDAPSIVFSRGSAGRLDALANSGSTCVSLDWTVDIDRARTELGSTPVQGNLDPSILLGDRETVRKRTREVIDAAGSRGHVLNLGHGVHRDTPVENVREFVDTAKDVER
ncbi:MAG: uroporphyrinogen decarboxylase [Halobacteriales archaeon]